MAQGLQPNPLDPSRPQRRVVEVGRAEIDTLVRENAARCRPCNQQAAPLLWRFTTAVAQFKLRKFYLTMCSGRYAGHLTLVISLRTTLGLPRKISQSFR